MIFHREEHSPVTISTMDVIARVLSRGNLNCIENRNRFMI